MIRDASHTVLLVEDNEPDARYIEELFADIDRLHTGSENERPCTPELRHVSTLSECLQSIRTDDIDILLLDLNLPDSRTLNTVDAVLKVTTDEAVVVLTGLDDERVGIEAIERGVQDYLVKDELNPTLLGRTIRYAIERQDRERTLARRNEELTLLNRLVRHDIRDDMALVRGWGQTLTPHVDAEGQEYLERMLEASEHVLEFTDRVGEFLDAFQNRDEVTLQPFDLQQILESELEKSRSVYDEARFEVASEIPAVEVKATRLLSSIFHNILANAVQHNDSETPVVRVCTTVDSDRVTVSIADNGPGIAANRKDAIFGRTDAGLGHPECSVGLYLVDTLVDMYEGHISVRDNEPRGCVFEVILQRADQQQ